MSRSTTRILLAAATAGLLTLTACGDKGSTGSNEPGTVVTTDSTATDSTGDVTDTTVAADSTTDTSTPVAGGAGSPESIDVIDAELEQAIADAEVLLGATDKDLADAKKAAASGG